MTPKTWLYHQMLGLVPNPTGDDPNYDPPTLAALEPYFPSIPGDPDDRTVVMMTLKRMIKGFQANPPDAKEAKESEGETLGLLACLLAGVHLRGVISAAAKLGVRPETLKSRAAEGRVAYLTNPRGKKLFLPRDLDALAATVNRKKSLPTCECCGQRIPKRLQKDA